MTFDLRNIEASEPAKRESLIPRETRITIAYSAPDGTRYDETLICRVPDGEGRTLIDRRAAILAGVSWAQLSEYAQARFFALATLSVHIIDLPDWLNQWAQEDDELLFAVRGEGERHALAWFRGGREASEDAEGAPRVRVSASHVTETA